MDADRHLDAFLLVGADALLSIASLAAAAGRPELARAASAALDPLLPFLEDAVAGVGDLATLIVEDRPHAEH
jgi:hypothetical protein